MISDASVPGSIPPDPETSPWRKVTAIMRRDVRSGRWSTFLNRRLTLFWALDL
jgi:hypothetical protein